LELLPGTLDLLILRALKWEPTHGHGVGVWLRMVTDGAVDLDEGSLRPALYRLERQGLITAEWGPSEKNRRARHYQLTAAGRQRFREASDRWGRYTEMMDRVLRYGASGSIRGR
jgi:transcriptional regulator